MKKKKEKISREEIVDSLAIHFAGLLLKYDIDYTVAKAACIQWAMITRVSLDIMKLHSENNKLNAERRVRNKRSKKSNGK